jgi:hypothetical protein
MLIAPLGVGVIKFFDISGKAKDSKIVIGKMKN